MTDTEDSRNEKRQGDGAEGLWRIGDEIYDLDGWATNHPGGSEWITLIQGTDITEAFEVFSDLEPFRSLLEFSNLAIFTSIQFLSQAHHVTLLAERLLPVFYVQEATTPRSCPFTFKSDGFYRIFEERAREAQKYVDFHNPTKTWNRNSYMTRSSEQTPRFSGVLLTWTSITDLKRMENQPRTESPSIHQNCPRHADSCIRTIDILIFIIDSTLYAFVLSGKYQRGCTRLSGVSRCQ
nr:uncharacterized protein LOC124219847 [Neodiprion pinetum]